MGVGLLVVLGVYLASLVAGVKEVTPISDAAVSGQGAGKVSHETSLGPDLVSPSWSREARMVQAVRQRQFEFAGKKCFVLARLLLATLTFLGLVISGTPQGTLTSVMTTGAPGSLWIGRTWTVIQRTGLAQEMIPFPGKAFQATDQENYPETAHLVPMSPPGSATSGIGANGLHPQHQKTAICPRGETLCCEVS